MNDRDRWEGILRAADQVWVATDEGRRWQAEQLIEEAQRRMPQRDLVKNVNPLFQARNRWMVDRAGLVIAVWDASASGTGNCVQYAEVLGRRIMRIDPAGAAS